MPTWRTNLGVNAGGVHNYAEYDEVDNTLTCVESQSAAVNQDILDDAHSFRRQESEVSKRQAQGRKVASIPIVEWWNWRKEYEKHCKGICTWQTYLLKRINDADYKKLLTTEKSIPTVYERERAREY